MLTGIGSSTSEVIHATSSSRPGQRTNGSGPVQRTPPIVTLTNRTSTSGVKCFGCSEIGHRQAYCKKQGKKALFVDPKDYEEEDAYMGEELVFDGTDEGDEEILEGDMGLALVVRHMCLMPRGNEDEWLRNNIF